MSPCSFPRVQASDLLGHAVLAGTRTLGVLSCNSAGRSWRPWVMRRAYGLSALVMVVAGLGVGGCTATGSHSTGFSATRSPVTQPAPATLTSFRSCGDALAVLRAATEKYDATYGVSQRFSANDAPAAQPAEG